MWWEEKNREETAFGVANYFHINMSVLHEHSASWNCSNVFRSWRCCRQEGDSCNP